MGDDVAIAQKAGFHLAQLTLSAPLAAGLARS